MKKLISMLLVSAMSLSLVACGGAKETATTETPAATTETAEATTETAEVEVQDVTLKVWAPEVDQRDENSWLNVMLPKFEEAHPEYNITWDVGVCGEGDAATFVKNDPAAAADVFFYANDQMGTLVEAGALAKLGGSYLETVQANFSQIHVDLLTYTDGDVYGFPTSPNTWFMWYNKEVFTEEDITNIGTMLEKGVVSFPMDNSWYTGSFFFGAGGTVFGPLGNDAAAGIDFSSPECVAAAGYMAEMVKSPNFVNDVDGAGVAGMADGTIHAMFSGDWDKPALEEALGENLGCAVLPKFTMDGTDYQMKSFAGNKAVGVNPNAANPKAAMELAAFLTSPEALLARYELSGYTPAATACTEEEVIKANPTVIVLNDQMANCAIVQPVIAEMSAFWDPVKNFGLNILNGSITADNAEQMILDTMELLNSTGL